MGRREAEGDRTRREAAEHPLPELGRADHDTLGMAPNEGTQESPRTDLDSLAIRCVTYRRNTAQADLPDEIVAGEGVITTPLKNSETYCRAYAAYSLRPRAYHAALIEMIGRQLHAVGFLLALPDALDWAVQLRVVAAPSIGKPPELTLSLLVSAKGSTPDLAVANLRDLASAVDLVGAFLQIGYRFSPVSNNATLAGALGQFQSGDIVEIGARDAVAGAIGLAMPLPMPDHAGYLHWLCQALLHEAQRQGCPLGWIVTLTGLDDSLLIDCYLDEQIVRLVAARDNMIAGSAHGTVATKVEVAAVEASGSALVQFRQSLRGLAGRGQAFLVSERGLVPPGVIAAAIAECSDSGAADPASGAVPVTWGRPVRPREVRLARRALREARCLPWQDLSMGSRARDALVPSLRHVGDVRQLARLFRLPVPGAGGLPGMEPDVAGRGVWLARPPVAEAGAILLGDNVAEGRRQPIRLPLDDRRRHTYLVGQTGVGKSTQLCNMVVQDLRAGRELAVFDFHGDLVEAVLGLIPPYRADDVVLLDPSDTEWPVGFNFLECAPVEHDRVVESFIDLLYQIFDPHHTGIIGPRFEHAVRNAILTVLASPGLTLIEVVRVLTDDQFMRRLLSCVGDPIVRRYWTDQIARTSDFHRSEVLDYIVSKFGPFVTNQVVRNIIGQGDSSFTMRQVMDEGRILLVNLSAGRLGTKTASFLGNILIPRLLQAAFSRADMAEEARRDFILYVDELQHYATPSFVEIISGARKYRLDLVMAHQHVGQLPLAVRQAVFGNVGTLLAMRVGVEDAALLAEALAPSPFAPSDIQRLPNFHAIVRALDHGQQTPAFTLATLPAHIDGSPAWAREIRRRSQRRFGRARAEVEAEIRRRADL